MIKSTSTHTQIRQLIIITLFGIWRDRNVVLDVRNAQNIELLRDSHDKISRRFCTQNRVQANASFKDFWLHFVPISRSRSDGGGGGGNNVTLGKVTSVLLTIFFFGLMSDTKLLTHLIAKSIMKRRFLRCSLDLLQNCYGKDDIILNEIL
uniref:Uncharacterized protein n=1 Tax=Glossina pallidipes TaxID=7398 RepID=A0A1A9ZA25_GLOPL